MSHSNQTLEEQIEELVRAHIEASRRGAAEAMKRGFSSVSFSPRTGGQPRKTDPAKRASEPRRSRAELKELGERLHEVVCAQPGETMAVLAVALGRTPRALARPMALLKQRGRVRSVGQRQHTRYFPAMARAGEGVD